MISQYFAPRERTVFNQKPSPAGSRAAGNSGNRAWISFHVPRTNASLAGSCPAGPCALGLPARACTSSLAAVRTTLLLPTAATNVGSELHPRTMGKSPPTVQGRAVPSGPLRLKAFSQFGRPRELELTEHRLLIADCCRSAHPSRYTSLSYAAPARSQAAIPCWKHAARQP